eukprot:3211656-Amphidinium_carterae.1
MTVFKWHQNISISINCQTALCTGRMAYASITNVTPKTSSKPRDWYSRSQLLSCTRCGHVVLEPFGRHHV